MAFTVQVAMSTQLVAVQPVLASQPCLRPCTITTVAVPVATDDPGVYAAHVLPLLVLTRYSSEQFNPPLPTLKVALTVVPAHTAVTLGVFALMVGPVGAGVTFQLARVIQAVPVQPADGSQPVR
jgi:hypothetical protein